jgi:hypothetical protein
LDICVGGKRRSVLRGELLFLRMIHASRILMSSGIKPTRHSLRRCNTRQAGRAGALEPAKKREPFFDKTATILGCTQLKT